LPATTVIGRTSINLACIGVYKNDESAKYNGTHEKRKQLVNVFFYSNPVLYAHKNCCQFGGNTREI